MDRDDLLENLRPLQRSTGCISAALLGGFAVPLLIFTVIVLIWSRQAERETQAKRQSISAGEVQPETLTVVNKYVNSYRHSTSTFHLILRSDRERETKYSVSQSDYDAAVTGSTVTGYHFSDGYFIPKYESSDEAPIGKWLFLGLGGLTSLIFMLAALRQLKKSIN